MIGEEKRDTVPFDGAFQTRRPIRSIGQTLVHQRTMSRHDSVTRDARRGRQGAPSIDRVLKDGRMSVTCDQMNRGAFGRFRFHIDRGMERLGPCQAFPQVVVRNLQPSTWVRFVGQQMFQNLGLIGIEESPARLHPGFGIIKIDSDFLRPRHDGSVSRACSS